MPRQRQGRNRDAALASAEWRPNRGALPGRTATRQSVPPLHGGLGLRPQREADRQLPPRSDHGPADRDLRRPAASPLRNLRPASLRLRSWPAGDADDLYAVPGEGEILPLERASVA